MTTIILWLMHYFPSGILRLRCDEETEILGVDDAELGEFAYDYVGLDAELGGHLPHGHAGPGGMGADVPALGAMGGGREPQHSHVKVHERERDESSSEHEKIQG